MTNYRLRRIDETHSELLFTEDGETWETVGTGHTEDLERAYEGLL